MLVFKGFWGSVDTVPPRSPLLAAYVPVPIPCWSHGQVCRLPSLSHSGLKEAVLWVSFFLNVLPSPFHTSFTVSEVGIWCRLAMGIQTRSFLHNSTAPTSKTLAVGQRLKTIQKFCNVSHL